MAKKEKKFKFWKTEIAESAENAENDTSTVDKITIFKKKGLLWKFAVFITIHKRREWPNFRQFDWVDHK